jgi:glycosyltransferase involved in cell wall biosynthesis
LQRVLIITYYWPPSGGSAVLRWLKFSKYLGQFSWEPVIYTPENPEPQEYDESLLSDIPGNLEVIKTKIIEPYSVYKFLTGKKKNERLGVALMNQGKKGGLVSRVSLWIRSNLFIPDPRMLWIKPSVKYLAKYMKQHPVDAVVTTGPPHSMHLIGYHLKRKTGIKWLADFRDPWTNIDFYNDLSLTHRADKIHHKLEKMVLLGADRVITVSPGMTEEFRSMGAKNITTITNGFDDLDTSLIKRSTEKFSILHLGSMPRSRNPENLWMVLSELTQADPEFRKLLEIRLIGKADQSVLDSLKKFELLSFVRMESYIPHNETPQILSASSLLLLCINNTPNAKGILTNKFFEYLSAKRPILAIGPKDGDAASILNESGAGKVFGYNETVKLKEHIAELFGKFSAQNLSVNSTGIDKYSRRNLTEQLSILLNQM